MTYLIIGSVGVGFLLLAFTLNLLKILKENSKLYLLMNFVGAGMAACYAFDGNIIPFVILELVWAAAAVIKLILTIKKGSQIVT
jgi:hypothetical protein